MSYGFSPELSRLVEQQMASGKYDSADDLLVDAIYALDGLCEQHEQLRSEIRGRLAKAGQGNSQPLDRDAFNAETRRRLAEES